MGIKRFACHKEGPDGVEGWLVFRFPQFVEGFKDGPIIRAEVVPPPAKNATTGRWGPLLAFRVPPLRTLLDPDDARFLKPGDMPAKIQAFARETGQPVPSSPGEFTRAILESLALLYRGTLAKIEQLTGRRIAKLHIVGGGSQSRLLNQFAADATGRLVLAGPVEATAIGNILVQAIADGQLASLAQLRETVRNSVPIEGFQPSGNPEWTSAFARFEMIRG